MLCACFRCGDKSVITSRFRDGWSGGRMDSGYVTDGGRKMDGWLVDEMGGY